MQNHEYRQKYPTSRPFILTLAGIIIVFGFFFFVLLCSSAGYGTGTGSGRGTGSGDGNGSGRGAGDSSGVSKTHEGTPQAAGEKGNGVKTGTSTSSGKSISQPKTVKKETGPNLSGPGIPGPVVKGRLKTREKIVTFYRKDLASSGGTTASAPSGAVSGGGGFYGIKVQGNTLFIVDTSGSMGSPTQEGTRIEMLKQQLKAVIKSSYRREVKTKYSIIAFNSSTSVYPAKGMKRFDRGYDTKVRDFVDSLGAQGGTHLMTAMETAVSLINDKENNVDTIFLLTDGEPAESWADILDYIRKSISPKKIVINCISIGRSCPEMKALSKEYKGTYKEIL